MTFLWDITKGAEEFSETDYELVRWWLHLLERQCPKTCSFLNLLPIDDMKFYWSPGMTLDNGVLGAWCVTNPNAVYMAYPLTNECIDLSVDNVSRSGYVRDLKSADKFNQLSTECITITLIHELIHKLQFQTSPIFYVFNRLITLFADRIPFVEQIGIEYDARVNSETKELKDFVYEFNSAFTSFYSAVRIKMPDDPKNWLADCYYGRNGNDASTTPKMRQFVDEAFAIINK